MSRLTDSIIRKLMRIPPFSWIHRQAESRRQFEILSHSFGKFLPNIPCLIVPDIEETERDVIISERILRAYRLASESHMPPSPDIWTFIKKSQSTFLSILDRGDPRQLAAYLCNMNRHDATTGTVQGNEEYNRIRRDSSYRNFVALMAKDKLLSLAEAVGVLPCENPEQGVYGQSFQIEEADLVGKISTAMGIDVTPPEIDGGLFKIKAGSGLFGERDLNAIFTANTLRQHGAQSVCEIGAGSGRVAYWSYRLGIRAYTLVDLPHINVIQSYYLLKALPDARVSLCGEPKGEIEILPCDADITRHFDLVLNQDSFPELSNDTVNRYLGWIKGHASAFLSINHESKPEFRGERQLSVAELIREIGGFSRQSRIPYWLRKGYVLEFYKVTPQG